MYASARRFFARFASEIFLSSLQSNFLSVLLNVMFRSILVFLKFRRADWYCLTVVASAARRAA